jgi:putative NADPH-quinone reductase
MNIDILQEQHLLQQYDKIVFQFPFYWFNCPPLFKKWLDEVLTHGWAYGRDSEYKLKDKVIALAITAGIREEDYQSTGKYQYTLRQLTAPFEVTFKYVKALYKSLFAFYGAEYSPSSLEIEKSVSEYISFIDKL